MAKPGNNHTHKMIPDRPVKPTVHGCASCAFTCTPRGLAYVLRFPGKHVRVKATDPQARVPYDGPPRG